MTAPVIPQQSPPPEEADPTGTWALVQRAQAGDTQAFGAIYDRYVDTVFRYVYFRVGNRHVAEDLCGDVWLRALKRIGSFTWMGRDFGAWLITISRNLIADHFKSGKYRFELTTGEVLGADGEDGDRQGKPEDAVVDHISNVALLAAVRRLTPDQMECIVLRYVRGLSVAETAVAMGRHEGAIKGLAYRACRALAIEMHNAENLLRDGERRCRQCFLAFIPQTGFPDSTRCPACVVARERFGSPVTLELERHMVPRRVTS